MEIFDIVTEEGLPTGRTVTRENAHAEGILHRTAHVWIVRGGPGHWQVLLQKRSMEKDSFPGQYDTSSAGHIPAGDEPMASALRELEEELGLQAQPSQLDYAGSFRIRYELEFHGKPFRDNEVTWVYAYRGLVDENALVLQQSEVDEVRWFDLEEVQEGLQNGDPRFCVPPQGMNVLTEYLAKQTNLWA